MTKAGSVTVRALSVGELPAFARRVAAAPDEYEILPITVYRADSQSRNPVADPDDIALLVAYLGERCIGYLGLLPVLITDGSLQRKVFSLTTIFVAPRYRKTAAGTFLMMRAMSLGHDLIIPGFTEDAARLYRALRLRSAGPLHYVRIRADMPLVLTFFLDLVDQALKRRGLHASARAVRACRGLLRRTLDRALQRIVFGFLQSPLRGSCRGISTRRVPEIVSPPGARIGEQADPRPRFVRTDDIVNWMIGSPWVREASGKLSYEFSYHRDIFRYVPLELHRESDRASAGFVVLSVSRAEGRGCVKILDYRLVDEGLRACVLGLALEEARRWSAEVVECGIEFARVPGLSLLHRLTMLRKERGYFAFTPDQDGLFGRRLGQVQLGFCDGDQTFV